jgi:hypothetical protein
MQVELTAEQTMIARIGEAQTGQWYQRTDWRQIFQVASSDARSQTLQLVQPGGARTQLSMSAWNDLPLWLAPPPNEQASAHETED